MHTRLQVLQPVSDTPVQDCYRCQNMPNCFKSGISDRHIVINLLTCRIKRGIDVNRSTKLLLDLVRPKLVKLSQEIINATGASGADRDSIFSDVQAEFIDLLLHKYVIGEWGYMLHYLFGTSKGFVGLMRRYVTSTITKRRKYDSEMVYGAGPKHEGDEGRSHRTGERYDRINRRRTQEELTTDPDETLDNAHIKALAARIDDIIEDGMTLRLAEYRVLRFCLDNATDAKRPLNGLHIYMGKVLGVVRSRCTKIYSDALLKIRNTSGFEESSGDFDWI